jgi:capsid protein
VAAEHIIHYVRIDRPGQVRGVPEITSALPLFAVLRRYVMAVLLAAESAASFAAVLKTVFPPMADDQGDGAGSAASVPAGMNLEIERNMITSLPEGWDISQLKAEQPTASFSDFHDKILNNIGCVLGVPFNVIACNSSGYNYASGRMDYQAFDLSLKVERNVMALRILDRCLHAWLQEAVLVEGFLPQALRSVGAVEALDHEWHWDGRDHVDPQKEANAADTRLKNGTTTLALEYARQGLDYEKHIDQWAKEVFQRIAALEKQGLTREQAIQIIFEKAITLEPEPEPVE